MGAICNFCLKNMSRAKGCTYSHARLAKKGEWVKRKVVSDCCCRDCGAKRGYHHHPDCLVEECPWCDEQALMCEKHNKHKLATDKMLKL